VASSFAALRSHQFQLLWIGQATSAFGGNLQQFALGWLLVQIAVAEGRPELAPLYIGMVGVSRGVPGLVFGLLGGVFADRMDRRRVLVVTRSAGSANAVVLALLVLTGNVHIAAVILLNGLGAVADAMELPLRQSLVGNILPARDLVGAQGAMNATFNTTQILAPLAAGLLIGPIGIGGLLLVSAAASVATVAALVGLAPVAPAHVTDATVLRSLGEGLLYVLREPVLRWVVVLSATASTFVRPLPTLMPAIAENSFHVGATGLSLLLTMSAIGGLVGAFLTVPLGSMSRQGRTTAALVVVWGVGSVLFALQRDFGAALVLAMLPTICWQAFASLSQLLCQAVAPDHLRGRALSLYSVSIAAFMPLGALTVGGLGTLLGIGPAIAIGGVLTTLVGAGVLAGSAAVRRVDLLAGRPRE